MNLIKLTQSEVVGRLQNLPDWIVLPDGTHIRKTYTLPDFSQALSLVNKIGGQAEQHNHHPEITLEWGKVTVTLSTHEVDGLTEKDFTLAEAIERARQA